MKKWKECKLGDIIEVIPGYAFKSENFINEQIPNSLPVIKIKNVVNGDVCITDVQYHNYESYLSKFIIKKNDVLIALTGNHPDAKSQVVGIVSRYKHNSNVLLNQRVAKILPNNGEALDIDFLYYFMKDTSTHQYLANQSSGSANQANISKSDIENIPLDLPSYVEQKAIASVLGSLDVKIDLLTRQNRTLESIAETLFRQWFIEEAKDNWEEGTLRDVINIFDSMRIPLSKMERDKKKDGVLYPYYGAAQIMDYINDYIFDGEYILFGEDGTVRTNEGYPVLQHVIGKFWVNNHTHVLQAKPPYSNFFIFNYLFKKNIDEIITGAVQPKINQGNLLTLDFPRFPEKMVVLFNNVSEPIFDKINHNHAQVRILGKNRDTLLPKLMSGEISIKN